jgi:LysM repeat protein
VLDGLKDFVSEHPILVMFIALLLMSNRMGSVAQKQYGSGPSPGSIQAIQTLESCRGQRYVVKSGDTLYGIALAYGSTVDAIASASGVSNPNIISPPQRLCIP